MEGDTALLLPAEFVFGRVQTEVWLMALALGSQSEGLEAWATSSCSEWSPEFREQYFSVSRLLKSWEGVPGVLSESASLAIARVLAAYNYQVRLTLDNLEALRLQYKEASLPPQTPCDVLEEQDWTDSLPRKPWIGHGFYWKASSGCEVFKDVGALDFDALEDGFVKLEHCHVLVADYELIRQDFIQLKESSFEEINAWLLDQAAYLSEGQIARIRDGDLKEMIFLPSGGLDSYFDYTKKKAGIRLKGGGRAATFLVDNKFKIEKGCFQAQMIDVKGVGTTKLQKYFDPKACGFLSQVDAMKEFAYEKLINKVLQNSKSEFSTVGTYAIIDTAIRFGENVADPATGYKGDRCVLLLRQRTSRLVAAPDTVVYYSVAETSQLQSSRGAELRKALYAYGISSEQDPWAFLCSLSTDLTSEDSLKGDWNIQTDATFDKLVDFSHFYVFPSSRLVSWRMSMDALSMALRLGAPHLSTFSIPKLCNLAFSTEDPEEAKVLYESEKPKLQERFQEFGQVGLRKPTFSWSWFLEVDDSLVMSWAMEQGMHFSGDACNFEIYETVRAMLRECG